MSESAAMSEGEAMVPLVTARSAFEAHMIVAILDDEGIEAFAFDTSYGGFGFSNEPYHRGVPVHVRHEDAEEARQALLAHRSDSVDIDWEKLEIGQREDYLPLHRPGRMPLPAKIAWVVTLLVLLAGTLGGLLVVVWPMLW